jgi:hypothetical protein
MDSLLKLLAFILEKKCEDGVMVITGVIFEEKFTRTLRLSRGDKDHARTLSTLISIGFPYTVMLTS